MAEFSIDLSKWVEGAEEKANLVVKSIIVDLMRNIDMRSPVGKREIWEVNIARASRGLPPTPKGYLGGHFRANWQLGVDTVPTGEINGIDPTGALTLSAAIGAIPDDVIGHRYHYVNNTPYALPLENGHSTQAPLGMVGLSILEWQGIVRYRAREGAA